MSSQHYILAPHQFAPEKLLWRCDLFRTHP